MESFARRCQACGIRSCQLTWGRPGSTKLLRGWIQPSGTAPWQQFVPKVDRELGCLTCCPTCRITKMGGPSFPSHFDVPAPAPPLPYRAYLPVWPPSRRFGPPPSSVRAGVLGQRGWALESVAARICLEGGDQVTTNVLLRWMASLLFGVRCGGMVGPE